MSDVFLNDMYGVVVEDAVYFSLQELSHACRTEEAELIVLVEEGVLTPTGDQPQGWCFAGVNLPRARTALRLMHDLELSTAGVALVLDLLDENARLKAQLQHATSH